MDNASKALIMAGSVLIALLVISIFMYAYRQFVDYTNNSTAEITSSQNESFNRYFVFANPESGKFHGYDAYNVVSKALDVNKTLDPANAIQIRLLRSKYNE